MLTNRQARARAYLAKGKDYRRWRMWRCFEEPMRDRERHVEHELNLLHAKGFKAKVWAPLAQHQTTGHTHIVVLCTFAELCKLGGIPFHRELVVK